MGACNKYCSKDGHVLTFLELRHANMRRLHVFKNSRGRVVHSKRDGSDWSLGDWITAIVGELGEAAGIIKQIKRGDTNLSRARRALAKELADIQIYLDILAFQTGISLDDAVVGKLNEVSRRVGARIRLHQPEGRSAATWKRNRRR